MKGECSVVKPEASEGGMKVGRMKALLKTNGRKKGTLVIKGLLRNLEIEKHMYGLWQLRVM